MQGKRRKGQSHLKERRRNQKKKRGKNLFVTIPKPRSQPTFFSHQGKKEGKKRSPNYGQFVFSPGKERREKPEFQPQTQKQPPGG